MTGMDDWVEQAMVAIGNGRTLSVTLSAGITECVPGDDMASLCTRADLGLYDAKRAGRNRVVVRLEDSRGASGSG